LKHDLEISFFHFVGGVLWVCFVLFCFFIYSFLICLKENIKKQDLGPADVSENLAQLESGILGNHFLRQDICIFYARLKK